MLAALALSALVASPGCSLPAAAARPFQAGERLAYDIDVLGLTQARAVSFEVASDRSAGRLALSAESSLRMPFSGARGRARSSIDPTSLLPSTFHDESDGGRSTTDSQLDREGLAVRVHWAKGARSGMRPYLKGGAVLDVVSALYYLRGVPLAAGLSFCFDAVGGRAYWRLRGRVAGTERVQAPAGSFEAFRLEGSAARADEPQRSYPIRLWIGADARRLPVRLTAGTALGTIEARLASVTGS